MDGDLSQKLPVNAFKWVEKLSRFNEIFIKNYNENSNIGYFLEIDIDYLKKLLICIKTCHFYLKVKKVNKVKKLICNTEDKKNMLCI